MIDAPTDGSPDSPLAIGEVTFGRAWNLHGDPRNAVFVTGAAQALGAALPLAPLTSAPGEAATLLWLGPRSWLCIGGDAATLVDFDAARRSVNRAGGALFDVSASYVGWRLSGGGAARALNRACPLDFHPRAFAAGGCAQSVLGHVNALFHRPGDAASFVVLVARSFAADALHALCEAARTERYRIAEPTPFGPAG